MGVSLYEIVRRNPEKVWTVEFKPERCYSDDLHYEINREDVWGPIPQLAIYTPTLSFYYPKTAIDKGINTRTVTFERAIELLVDVRTLGIFKRIPLRIRNIVTQDTLDGELLLHVR